MTEKEKTRARQIPAKIMGYIVNVLKTMRHGEVVLIAQDGLLIQLEHTERLRVSQWTDKHEPAQWTADKEEAVRRRILQEFSKLSYGRLFILVQQGAITQFNRLEMQRFIDGEGI